MRTLIGTIYGIYGALIFVPMALLTLALMLLPLPLEARRWIGGTMMRVTLVLLGVRTTVRGREHIPDEVCVFVSNHQSQLDGLVWMAFLPPRFQFVVKADAAAMPVFGHLMRRAGVIWVDRKNARSASATLRTLLRKVEAGQSLVMFPEGTIVSDPGLLRFKAGAFMLANRADIPVLPGVLRGTRGILGEAAKLPSHGRIDLEILPPMRPPNGDHEHGRQRSRTDAIKDAVRAEILSRCDEPDAARREVVLP